MTTATLTRPSHTTVRRAPRRTNRRVTDAERTLWDSLKNVADASELDPTAMSDRLCKSCETPMIARYWWKNELNDTQRAVWLAAGLRPSGALDMCGRCHTAYTKANGPSLGREHTLRSEAMRLRESFDLEAVLEIAAEHGVSGRPKFNEADLTKAARVETWHFDAPCASATNPDDFFPDDPGAPAPSMCGRCPVRVQCLVSALQRREPYGAWGGLTNDQLGVVYGELDRAAHLRRTRAALAADTA